MTIAVTRTVSGETFDKQYSAKVYIITGQHASPIGTTGEGSSTVNNLSPTLFTASGNGRAIYCGMDWSASGLPTSTDTEDAATYTDMSCLAAYKSTDHSSGAVSGNLDGFGSGACAWNWCAIEIFAADGAPAATSFHPEVLSRASRTHFLMR